MKKLISSLEKTDTFGLVFIPLQIESNCIINAKTDEAKRRLVHAVIQTVAVYQNRLSAQKKASKTLIDKVMELFN